MGGENGLSIPSLTSETADPAEYYGFIRDKYASWGYREHYIGAYQQEVVRLLKK